MTISVLQLIINYFSLFSQKLIWCYEKQNPSVLLQLPVACIYLAIPAMCSGHPAWWGPAAGVFPSGQQPYVVAAHELATAYAIVLGVSQLMPDQCTGQWHSYEDPLAMQTPPCSHGLGWQWSSSSQVIPVHPEMQEHKKSSPSISHTPPWWHGLGWQLSRSAQLIPLKPGWQVHVYPPLFSKQVPPFWQGDEWHLSSKAIRLYRMQMRILSILYRKLVRETTTMLNLSHNEKQRLRTVINNALENTIIIS